MLSSTDIKEWNEVKDNFKGSNLLLGNGFSVNLHSKFVYDSLFEKFISGIHEDQRTIFRSFGTTNFEVILQNLQITKKVNDILFIDCAKLDEAIKVLREGLIKTVKENHPRKSEIDWERLKLVANILEQFNDIYTLSYDALLYHIILLVNDRYKTGQINYRYNDYFWAYFNDNFLEFRDFQNYADYRHVYYLHGTLFIFKHLYYDLKIRNNNIADELIELISMAINDNLIPLFISEGSADEKMLSISQSDYLRFSNNMLKIYRGSLVIFGANFSDSDKHIVDAINKNRRNIAIGIYTNQKSEEQIEDMLLHYTRLFKGQNLVFFRSSSLFN